MKALYYLSGLALIAFAGCHSGGAQGNTDTTISTTDSSAGVKNTTVLANKDSSVLGRKDSRFLEDAYQGGLFEVELGTIAQNNAADPRVREFGTMMIQDHGHGDSLLKNLAANKGLTLPDSISDSQKRERGRLFNESNADFDKDYVKVMVSDHTSDIKDFENESINAQDPDVKAFAESMLKTLHTHLDHAQTLQRTIK